jgi:hypothetical protein
LSFRPFDLAIVGPSRPKNSGAPSAQVARKMNRASSLIIGAWLALQSAQPYSGPDEDAHNTRSRRV